MSKRIFAAVCMGVLIGIFVMAGIRFVTYRSDQVHHHANFSLYINGQKDEFKNFTFYEEVNACAGDHDNDPKSRVHMHSQNSGLVHVHASGVTWGHFFANLNYALGNTLVKTDSGVYVDGNDGNKLTFILNGKPAETIANRLIVSEDRLLINYGNDDAKTLGQRFDMVATDAAKANTENDPSSCSGGEEITLTTRLKYAFGFATN